MVLDNMSEYSVEVAGHRVGSLSMCVMFGETAAVQSIRTINIARQTAQAISATVDVEVSGDPLAGDRMLRKHWTRIELCSQRVLSTLYWEESRFTNVTSSDLRM
jgi:hypothetical protein